MSQRATPYGEGGTAAVHGRPALVLRNVEKVFGTYRALADVSITIRQGEVHALVGENGSGKSTLIKILAGFHAPEGGSLEAYGSSYDLPLTPDAREAVGLSFVHQDLGLIPSLSVLENLKIGDLAVSPGMRRIRWSEEHRRAEVILSRYGIEGIDPRRAVGELTPLEQAQLAIVRAVESMLARGEGRGVLVLDEPTVFLPRDGVETLFRLVRDITGAGASVLFVSHDLDEVLEIADSVSVLRDGSLVGTRSRQGAKRSDLVEMILGKPMGEMDQRMAQTRVAGGSVAEIRGLTTPRLHDVDLTLNEGEIVGVTGLAGSGYEDIPYHVFGARAVDVGTLRFEGRDWDLRKLNPQQAWKARLALIPAERRTDGIAVDLTVEDNVTLQVLERYRRYGINKRARRDDAVRLCEDYDVRPRRPSTQMSALSGGNQQKVVVAKWLTSEPRVLLLHEPTQGVDIGAREQIISIVRDFARQGNTVLCASSDHEQLALMCDRVVVFTHGVPTDELVGDRLTKRHITQSSLTGAAEKHTRAEEG